jgi:putative tryptophan/tyrosine transport system substrate-binding protein
MRRREFVALLGGSVGLGILSLEAGGWVARAQSGKVPRIGVLLLGNPNPEPFLKAFRAGLNERGYMEGRNIALDIRSADGDMNRLNEAADEMVRLPVDILVAWQTLPATAARRATQSIPIVMAGVGDPVGSGLVESLARPGGNVTGIAGFGAELAGKNLELIRELMPQARRVGVLLNGPDPFSKPLREQAELAASKVGVTVHVVVASAGNDIEAMIAELVREGVDVVFAQPSLPQQHTVQLAMRHRLPVVAANRGFTEAGGIMSYASKGESMFMECAAYVDRILKGARPGELPVQGPKASELVVNLNAARALGITVPQELLARANEVIE